MLQFFLISPSTKASCFNDPNTQKLANHKEYMVTVQGKQVQFSYPAINSILRFLDMPPAGLEAFSLKPNYMALHHTLCGHDFRATWFHDIILGLDETQALPLNEDVIPIGDHEA
ncbi:hypothetical protein HAX54_004300 [Datura stramonium]|uniref:Sulfotransferase n=1 Tax=Datura stramonium TaxID=4076 RepID=A0ABS8WV75_DATST|nr:hypothetical protein [Datura stramonium]